MKQFLFWMPRVLAILFALFVGLFALDVFSEGYSLGEAIVGFVIHLVPTWLILGALAIAWRWERLGAALFLGLGGLFLWWFGIPFQSMTFLLIIAPLFVVSALFMIDWRYRSQRPAGV